jgi:light-regulated signal transduction histidine kinase (bacteriophytochrome)
MLARLTPEAPQVTIENRFESADGPRWTLWTNRALSFDEKGQVEEAQSTGIDITDRKRAEEALRRANEALRRANRDLEQFAYSASHDLQEPIRNISISAQLLARRCGPAIDTTGTEHLSYIIAGASRMQSLVRDLLAYSQVANSNEEPLAAVNAGDALQAALTNLSTAILDSHAEITSDPLPLVPARGAQLQQVFQNLISNAIKYKQDGARPTIHVTGVREGLHWVFSVRDNGMGIPAEYHKRVFGIFKRLHRDGQYPGTGIGLAICQRIVERHGGRIWVESKGTGHGSTFHFTLLAERAV